jgi:histidinol phosphatase-like enzyme
VIYWHSKQCDAIKMYQKLLARLRDCHSHSAVINWIKKLKRGEDIHQPASGSGRSPNDCLPVLLVAPEQSLFHSVRSFASAVQVLTTTVSQHLYSFGNVLCHLYTVPHTHSPNQTAARVAFAIEVKKF